MLTERQQQIWNYLVEYVDQHGYPPTVREIGERVGLASPSTVHRLVGADLGGRTSPWRTNTFPSSARYRSLSSSIQWGQVMGGD